MFRTSPVHHQERFTSCITSYQICKYSLWNAPDDGPVRSETCWAKHTWWIKSLIKTLCVSCWTAYIFQEVVTQRLEWCCHRPAWASTTFFFEFFYSQRRAEGPQSAFIYSKVNNLCNCTTLHLCHEPHFCFPFRGDVGTSSDLSLASYLYSDTLHVFIL